MTNCAKRDYSPFGSANSGMSFTEPVTVARDHITLQYPLVTPTLDVDIRNPNMGDQQVLSLAKVLNKSRSGTINMSESLHKPKTTTFTYQLQNLCEDDKIALMTFIEGTVGQMIRVIDYETLTWNVIITNPSAALSQLSREMPYGIQLQFKGSLE